MSQIAVLMTCFNRRDITIRCLNQLFLLNKNIAVFLVDDNSTDGTSAAISIQFPQVNIIQGNGNLFWSRGMHLGWEYASKNDYDYYIWLNDDTLLDENCFIELFQCSKIANESAIITGIVQSQDNTQTLYGGTNQKKKLLLPNGTMQDVTNMNGNIVLVPKSVFKILGNLDPVFHHDLGDVDYGLRAKKNNINVFTTRVAIGSGEANSFCRVRLWNSTIVKRFKKLYSPLGNHPLINFYFRRKHFGVFNALNYYTHIHLINLFPDCIIKLVFGTKYIDK